MCITFELLHARISANIYEFLLLNMFIAETPFGQLPVLETAEGMLCNSNVIARHVARKLGNLFLEVGFCPKQSQKFS